jgi:hypothetical protein
VDADFFVNGGHSLAAIEAVSALESALGCQLEIASLFERPTLREYVRWLDARLAAQLRVTHGDEAALARGVA